MPPSPDRVQIVPQESDGDRVDVVLARWLDVSRSEARALLASGTVTLDGRPLGRSDKGVPVGAGCELRVEAFVEPTKRAVPAYAGKPLAVLAHGPGWLALDKPAGTPVHPLRDDQTATVLGFVAAHHPEVNGVGEGGLRSGVVHRLDVDTSGVLLVATDQAVWERLRGAFTDQRIRKVYLAIVHGRVGEPRTLDLRVRVAQHKPAKVRVVEEGRDHPDARWISMTVEPIEQLGRATLVRVEPKTGFLHQIRVALAHVGHPIYGDATYGESRARRDGAERHMLHAASVAFEEVEAACDPPADFETLLASLRKA